jgi:hypothetical protein
MKSYRWEGHATARSSIAHGGETLGTVTYLRREAFLTPHHGRTNIPVISGNAVRGSLRDTAAMLLWEALDRPTLPMPVAHALWAGGALVKSKGQPLTGQRLADLRTMVAHIGVFGAAGGGRILDSALTVAKMVPHCTQTQHLFPDAPPATATLDMHDLLQIEYYSRIPDTARLTGVTDPNEDTNPDDGLMRYGTETFIAGTTFDTMFALTNATPDEYAFFTETLTTWLSNATIGGKTGRGHGRIDLTLTTTSPAPEADWRTFGGASTQDVLKALTWLD